MAQPPGDAAAGPRLMHDLRVTDPRRKQEITSLAAYLPSGPRAPRHPRVVVGLDMSAENATVFCCGTGTRLADFPSIEPQCVATYDLPDDGPVRIVVGTAAGEVSVYDGENFTLLHPACAFDSPVTCLTTYFEPGVEGRARIAAGLEEGVVRVIDGESGAVISATEVMEEVPNQLLAYAHQGRQRLVVAGRRGKIWVVDPETGQCLHDLEGHSGNVRSLVWYEPTVAPGEIRIVSASWDHTAKVRCTGRVLSSSFFAASVALTLPPVVRRCGILRMAPWS
jgi:WD40 repeat protein